MNLDLDAIKARAKAVPAGEARFVPEPKMPEIGSVIINTPEKSHAVVMMYAWKRVAEFFIAAREDVPALVAEIRDLRKELDDAKAALARHGGDLSIYWDNECGWYSWRCECGVSGHGFSSYEAAAADRKRAHEKRV